MICWPTGVFAHMNTIRTHVIGTLPYRGPRVRVRIWVSVGIKVRVTVKVKFKGGGRVSDMGRSRGRTKGRVKRRLSLKFRLGLQSQ